MADGAPSERPTQDSTGSPPRGGEPDGGEPARPPATFGPLDAAAARAALTELHTALLPHLPGWATLQAARDLGLLRGGSSVVLDREDDLHYLLDRAFHDVEWAGASFVRHVAASEAAGRLPAHLGALLAASCAARYSLFEAQALPGPADGWLEVRDLLGAGDGRLFDPELARCARGPFLLATRVVSLPGVALTAGAACPFEPFLRERLLRRLRRTRRGVRRRRRILASEFSAYFFRELKRVPLPRDGASALRP